MKNKQNVFILILIILLVSVTAASCIWYAVSKNDAGLPDDGGTSGGQGGDGGDNPDIPTPPEPVEKTTTTDRIKCNSYVEYGKFVVNADSSGNPLSLYNDGEEVEFSKGYFAHAYSVIVFDDIGTLGLTRFTAYIGANKTARVANTQTSIIFKVLVDDVEVFSSEEFNAYTNMQEVSVDITGANRLSLVADSLGSNGHDHAVWADCKFTYFDNVKPNLQVYDVEFASPYSVTDANLREIAKATAFDGRDLSDSISYTTDYRQGQTGEFEVTYTVSDGVATAKKAVTMTVFDQNRFVTDPSDSYLTSPFADFVYYGRSLLSESSQKAYDILMTELLAADISDSSKTTVTVNLQEKDIYILAADVSRIKTYLIYDEARLYYLYDWRSGEGAGVSYTLNNGFVNTVTVNLNNGANGYYYGQDNLAVYRQAESEVSGFLSRLSDDMTEAQALYVLQNLYCPTIRYANVNYADGFYGAFINKQCICSGYSKGYGYLAQRAGVRSAYIVGTAGGAHAWNYIYADGGWYMTDTTWGNGNSFGLLGKDYMDSAGRYDHGNYHVMPVLSATRYDLALMKYNLFTIKDNYLVEENTQFDPTNLVTVASDVEGKADITDVTYSGNVNTSVSGKYPITVTARNSLGNVKTGECTVFVYSQKDYLSEFTPTMTGNSNYAFRTVSLYYGGERQFDNGLYTKANGTLTLDFDISGNYNYFSGYVGVEKVIRDNVDWGWQVNATVRVYADGTLLFEKTNIGWKTDMTYIALPLPDGTQRLRLEITDNTGQGGIGWGDCTLYS